MKRVSVRVQCPYQPRKYRCKYGELCQSEDVTFNECYWAERYKENPDFKKKVDNWQKARLEQETNFVSCPRCGCIIYKEQKQ